MVKTTPPLTPLRTALPTSLRTAVCLLTSWATNHSPFSNADVCMASEGSTDGMVNLPNSEARNLTSSMVSETSTSLRRGSASSPARH